MTSNTKKSTPLYCGGNNKEPNIIYANYMLREGLVHVISSHKFYLNQMQWCVASIRDFWQHIVRVRRGVLPDQVPMALRFCISWLTGYDCTHWSAREVCVWLKHNVGHNPNGPNGVTPMYINWGYGNGHRVNDLPKTESPTKFTPLRVPTTMTLPTPQFLFPAMEPPEDSDVSSTTVDVGVSETECVDVTDENMEK